MSHWDYTAEHGPHAWSKHFPCAAGQHQSPIDIKAGEAEFCGALQQNPLQINFKSATGFSPAIAPLNFRIDVSDNKNTLEGGPLDSGVTYQLAQFHFHWAAAASSCCAGGGRPGSEHLLDGRSWPTELHLVTFNASKYATFGEAADKPDGLAVLGVFFDVQEEGESAGGAHPGIQQILDLLQRQQNDEPNGDAASTYPVDSIDLHSLLPSDTQRYFTYPGSLTTPPCFESVRWIVFEAAQHLSAAQLAALHALTSSSCGNFRPVCPLNGRVVQRSFE